MSENTKNVIMILLLAVILALLFTGKCTKLPQESDEPEPKVFYDTISLHDTIIKWKVRVDSVTHYDTTFVFIKDSVGDSLQVELPITHNSFSDSVITDSSKVFLDIRYSGFQASLDEVNVRTQYTLKPETVVKKTGWGPMVVAGVHLGYGASVTPTGQVYLGPELSLGITVGFGYKWK